METNKKREAAARRWQLLCRKYQLMPESQWMEYVRKQLSLHHKRSPHPDDRIEFGEFYNELASIYGRQKRA